MAYAGVYAEVLQCQQEGEAGSESLYELAKDYLLGLAEAQYPGSFALQGLYALLRELGYGLQIDLPAAPETSRPMPGNSLADSPARVPSMLHVDLAQCRLHGDHAQYGPNDFPHHERHARPPSATPAGTMSAMKQFPPATAPH